MSAARWKEPPGGASPQARRNSSPTASLVSEARSTFSSVTTEATAADLHEGPAWVPDDDAQDCAECFGRFSLTRRRHHCRLCGGVVCAACSESRVFIGESKLARACNTCASAAPRLRKACVFLEELDNRISDMQAQMASPSSTEGATDGQVDAATAPVRQPGASPRPMPSKEHVEELLERISHTTDRLELSWKASLAECRRRELTPATSAGPSSLLGEECRSASESWASERRSRRCIGRRSEETEHEHHRERCVKRCEIM
mmetsp:Transcript_144977/g.255549  ORF Transcript_144977/g.255549 Transcript_144977/m.255549 type:complete len:260 (-) Transcript_144977:66-845(-)